VTPRIAIRLQVMRIIWIALMVSVVLYDVMLVQLRKQHDPSGDVPPHLPEMLALLAVVIAIVSFVLPRRLFTVALKRVDVKVAEEPGEVVGSFRESAPVRRAVSNPEVAVLAALAGFQSPFLVGMALCESIALFGFLLGFLGESMKVALGFFLVSLALMAVRYPRVTTMTRAIESSTGAKCVL
jgi:hypothetical protein